MTMNNTLTLELWPATGNRAVRSATLAFAGVLLLAACSKISIPFYPVPLTMQTFAVLTLGVAYGWRLGASTLLLYLAIGAAGVPLFAGEDGGAAVLFGGTGGYLLGFVLAAALCGWLAERGWDRSFMKTAAAMLLGNVVIYVPGLLWLGHVHGWDKPILEWGLTPFVLGDLTKLALAATTLPLAWHFLNRRRGK